MSLFFPESKLKSTVSLAKFHRQRNKILICRETGGLGDILMHRQMFEDFKKVMPEAEIHFALPKQYHEAVQDHPFIDKILDSKVVNQFDYVISYNTTSACTRHEMKQAPFSDKNRSDIWANHCGVLLTRHDMHIHLSEEELQYGIEAVAKIKTSEGPSVAICPISAMTTKNLTEIQQKFILDTLKDRGYFAFGLHNKALPYFLHNNIPLISNVNIRQWMAVLAASDYVIAVDTASFHFAGGYQKPLMGIFTFADGKVYGKYYDFVLVQKHRDDGNWECGPCYNWGCCSKTKKSPKPCLTEITTEMLQVGIDKLFKKWPTQDK